MTTGACRRNHCCTEGRASAFVRQYVLQAHSLPSRARLPPRFRTTGPVYFSFQAAPRRRPAATRCAGAAATRQRGAVRGAASLERASAADCRAGGETAGPSPRRRASSCPACPGAGLPARAELSHMLGELLGWQCRRWRTRTAGRDPCSSAQDQAGSDGRGQRRARGARRGDRALACPSWGREGALSPAGGALTPPPRPRRVTRRRPGRRAG